MLCMHASNALLWLAVHLLLLLQLGNCIQQCW
jgi:hypothetical protein